MSYKIQEIIDDLGRANETAKVQRALIEQQATQIAMADHAYQLLAEAHEQQAKEITRLREALENIVEGEGLWTKNDMAHEAVQALKEEHP